MVFLAILLCLLATSCGGGSSTPAPTPNPSNPYTFTLTSSGISPKELTVPAGSRVLFLNSDSRAHYMASDPHPEHDLCHEMDSLGLLQNGEQRETLNLVTPKICGFHDHDNPPPAGNIWTGRIVIR